MKAKIDMLNEGQQRQPKELAILYRRFQINSEEIIKFISQNEVPPYSESRNKMINSLQQQVKDATMTFGKLMHKIKAYGPSQHSNPITQNAITNPINHYQTSYGQSFAQNQNLYPSFSAPVPGVAGAIHGYQGPTQVMQNNPIQGPYPGLAKPQSFMQRPGTASIKTNSAGYPDMSSSSQMGQNGYTYPDLRQAQSYPGMSQHYHQQPYGSPQNNFPYQQYVHQSYTTQPKVPITQSTNGYPQTQRPQTVNPSMPVTLPPSSSTPSTQNQYLVNLKNSGNLRTVYCPLEIIELFIKESNFNTKNELETCGILAGSERNDALIIDTLILPQQEGHCDHCFMTDEIELFETQITHKVMTTGWIHTHPIYDLFLSSVDLHNQLGYQMQLPEAVAVVYSPIEREKYKGFRVRDAKIKEISQCQQKGFHQHNDPSGLPAFEECKHVMYIDGKNNGIRTKLIDLRKPVLNGPPQAYRVR